MSCICHGLPVSLADECDSAVCFRLQASSSARLPTTTAQTKIRERVGNRYSSVSVRMAVLMLVAGTNRNDAAVGDIANRQLELNGGVMNLEAPSQLVANLL